MTKEDIFQSGFISNFIIEYYEKQIHSYYPDKDRLLYVFCDNEEEKQNVSKEQIKIIKAKISDLGFEELSFSYLLSCKPESLHNFIKSENRFEFWVKRFAEEFDYNFESFDPITQGICNFNDVSELTIEAMENEDSFWELYPKNSKPQTQDFVTIIPNETDIISLVQYDIELFNKNTYWEFDFDDYHKYINVSKPLEILFNLSELLVQLNRLEMFKSLLQQESIEDKVNVLQKPKFTVFETIMKELNFVAWVFECQVSDVSYNSLPVIHQKGRYLPNVISVQSNIQMLKIQDYFQHYTERFERANDKTVISNELVEIYKRAKQIMSFYDENLHSDSDVATSYFEKLPNDFKNKIDYNKKHTALIVVDDLQIFDIYFEVGDLTFNVKDKNYYDENRYTISYLTDNSELLRFCQKLVDFADKFIDEVTPIKKTLPPRQKTKTNANNLEEIITHQNSVNIVECIKIQYKNIQGKRLKLLLIAMQELNLLPKERIAKKFHDYCKTEFDWSIASYEAMNNYTFNKMTDNDEVTAMKDYISNIANTN